MSLKVFGFFVIVLAVASPSSIYAQDSSRVTFLIGPIAGYGGVAYNTGEFPAVPSKQWYFPESGGGGPSKLFGISSEIPISSGMDKFLIIEALYESYAANFYSEQGTLGDSSIAMSGSLSYTVVNVGFKYNMVSNGQPSMFGLQACVSFGWAINNSLTTYFDSINYVNGNYDKPYVVKSQTSVANVDGLNEIRIAIRTELTYDIPLGSQWILTPYFGIDTPLTKVDNTSRDWSARSAYGAIALRYAFGAP